MSPHFSGCSSSCLKPHPSYEETSCVLFILTPWKADPWLSSTLRLDWLEKMIPATGHPSFYRLVHQLLYNSSGGTADPLPYFPYIFCKWVLVLGEVSFWPVQRWNVHSLIGLELKQLRSPTVLPWKPPRGQDTEGRNLVPHASMTELSSCRRDAVRPWRWLCI